MNLLDGQFRQVLKETIAGEILFDEPTARYTSIGVGGRADAIVFPRNRDELRQIVACLRSARVPFYPAGNWTNLIVKDGGYRGVIISLQGLNHIACTEKDANYVRIDAEAGVSLADVVRLSVNESLTGMEFCSGIPGSVGGAVRMNAGAYGKEIKDVIESITLMATNGNMATFERSMLAFNYRNLEQPAGGIIVSALFILARGIKEDIRARISQIIHIRKDKHPLEYRNAGSIFKNPAGSPAGQIIEAIGLKGVQIGDAKISEKHGNFIINTGNATAKDILALMDMVQKRALSDRSIHLEPEVRIIGEDE